LKLKLDGNIYPKRNGSLALLGGNELPLPHSSQGRAVEKFITGRIFYLDLSHPAVWKDFYP
jgi:hypothetical protein